MSPMGIETPTLDDPASAFETTSPVSFLYRLGILFRPLPPSTLSLKSFPLSFSTSFGVEQTNPEHDFEILYPTVPQYVNDITSLRSKASSPAPMLRISAPVGTHTTSVPTPSPENSTTQDHYHQLIDRIEERKEVLRDARDDLVGSRFRLHTQRQQYRALRHEAQTQVTSAIDAVQKYLYDQNLRLPDNVQKMLLDAAVTTAHVGEYETGLDDAEEKYNLEEWKYTEKEKTFIEDLPGSQLTVHTALPIPPLHTEHSDTEHFASFTSGPQDVVDRYDLHVDSSYGLGSSTASSNVAEVDHKTSRPASTIHSDVMSKPTTRLHGSRSLPFTRRGDGLKKLTRPHSEEDLANLRGQWLNTRRRIDTWLLEVLSMSRFQQGVLKSLLPQEHMEDEDWWRVVQFHWYSNSSRSGGMFHTGDTTMASHSIASQPTSTTRNLLFGIPSLASPRLLPSSATPLVAGDHIVDALNDSPLFPAAINIEDLDDLTHKHVTFTLHSWGSGSRSTSPAAMTRTSSYIAEGASPGAGAYSSCTSSEEGNANCEGSVASTIAVSNIVRDCSPQSTNTASASSAAARTKTLLSVDRCSLAADQHTITPHTNPIVVPAIPTSQGQNPTETQQSTSTLANANPSSSDSWSHELIPKFSHKSSKAAFLESSRKTRPPIFLEPYIRVESPEPWNLPLLRLTPYAPFSYHEPQHPLDDLPFVYDLKSPYRLPGPL